MNILDLTISGMHCDDCATRISSLLEKEAGVREVSISYETGTASLVYHSHAIEKKRIVAVIERAGFTVSVD